MTHRFNVSHPIPGITLQKARQLLGVPAFHEQVARNVPGYNLKILESSLVSSTYVMRREVNMEVNIPDIAKKFLKDAFKVWRTEEWDIERLTCCSHIKLNMPGEFRCQITLLEEAGSIVAHHAWEVDVHVPLIHGILARHAESEIRRFNQIEIETIQREFASQLTA